MLQPLQPDQTASEPHAAFNLSGKRVADKCGRVSKEKRTEAHGYIDIFISIDIADSCSGGSLSNDGIADLLPWKTKIG